MHEGFISRTSLVAALLWLGVVTLFAVAWFIAVVYRDLWLWAGMLAATGLGMSAVAATAQMRLYALRMCSLIRNTSGSQLSDRREVQSIR